MNEGTSTNETTTPRSTRAMVVQLAVVTLVGLVLTGIAVAPQLSARLTGDEYLLRVAPVDPIDPFRGAYVDLGYPDLQRNEAEDGEAGGFGSMEDGERGGDLYVTLVRDGKYWTADEWTRDRPAKGPYLACSDRDWLIRCGIESWFLPQDKAKAMESTVGSGDATARVRIDGRGHGALIAVETD